MNIDDLRDALAGSYYRKGAALAIIQAEKRYLPDYRDFELFCQATQSISLDRARQLMQAAEVVANLRESKTGAALPPTEAQCRVLHGLPADVQVLVWDYAVVTFRGGPTTRDLEALAAQAMYRPGLPLAYITKEDVPDSKLPSDNPLEIPVLNTEWQARSIDLPVVCYGSTRRGALGPGTYHFYTEDYRFNGLWDDPTPVINAHVINAIEPNFSIYDNTPRVVGLYRIYLKRWLARFWQSYGVRILVDMNVSPQFYDDNLIGVPMGWRAYATRGYSDRIDQLVTEHGIAQMHAASNDILWVVYGGGASVQAVCQEYGWLWFPEQREVAKANG